MSADRAQHAARESGEDGCLAEVSLGGDEAAARVLADGVVAVIGHIDITSQG